MRRVLTAILPFLFLGLGACGPVSSERATTVCGPYIALTDDINADEVLDGGCYLVENGIYVNANLVVTPSTTVAFAQDAFLEVTSTGSLSAVGFASNPIVFTGDQDSAGYWQGIYFVDSNDVNNVLSYVTIEDAGGYSADEGNLIVRGTSRLSLTESTLRRSAAYGMTVEAGATFDAFAGNHLTANASGAALMDVDTARFLDANTFYTGNTVDIVKLDGSSVSHAGTWAGIDAEYLVSQSFYVDNDLVIQPGAVFQMGSANWIEVASSGSLKAVGTSSLPILFTGEQGTRGYWDAIYFNASNDMNNVLTNVIVEYGGKLDGSAANVVLQDGSSVSITNSTLQSSSGYGMQVDNNVALDFALNTLTSNAKGAAQMDVDRVGDLDALSTYTGNDTNNDIIDVVGGTMSSDQIWPTIDAVYYVEQSFYVSGAWDVDPGVTVLFNADTWVEVLTSGSLTAVGTAAAGDGISFLGAQATQGYWGGIFIDSSSSNNMLSYVTIADGGNSNPAANLTLATGSAALDATYCAFENSLSYGIYVVAGATLNEFNNTFSGNAGSDIFYE